MLTYLLEIWWLYAYIPFSIIIIQHFIDMRTSNVDQMILKHAFQTSFSLSSRLLDLFFWFSSSSQVFDSDATFWNFSYWRRIFFHVSKCMRNRDQNVIDFSCFDQNRLIFIKFTISRFIIFWFSSSSQVRDLDATLWNFSYKRRFFFHVNVCMQNRHSVIIVNLIKNSDKQESYKDWTRFSKFKNWTKFSAYYEII
jgi:hypothetical protein